MSFQSITVTAQTTPLELFQAIQAIEDNVIYIHGVVSRNPETKRPFHNAARELLVYEATSMLKGRNVLLRLVGSDTVPKEASDKMMESIEKGEYVPTKVGDDAKQYVADAGSSQVEIDVSVRQDCKIPFTTGRMQGRNSNFEATHNFESVDVPIDLEMMFKDTPYAPLFKDTGYMLTYPEMLIQGMKAAAGVFHAEKGEVDMARVRGSYGRLAKIAEKNKVDIQFQYVESSQKTERRQFAEHLFKVIFTSTKPSIAKACGGMVPLPKKVFDILDGNINVDMEHPLFGFEATQKHSNNRIIQAVCYLLHNVKADSFRISQYLWTNGGMELEFAQHGDAMDIYDYAWGHCPCPRAVKDSRAIKASKPSKGAFGFGALIAVILLFADIESPAFSDVASATLKCFGLSKQIVNEDGVIDQTRFWLAVTNLLNVYIAAIEGGF